MGCFMRFSAVWAILDKTGEGEYKRVLARASYTFPRHRENRQNDREISTPAASTNSITIN